MAKAEQKSSMYKLENGTATGWPAEIWRRHGRDAAQSEGWDLFVRDDNDQLEIEVINDLFDVPALLAFGVTEQVFPSDNEAVAHVVERAGRGSKTHLLALYLEGRRYDDERGWVPPELLPPSDCDERGMPTNKALVRRMKIEIVADVREGNVQPGVANFSALHDYVDANLYGGTEDLLERLDSAVPETDEDQRIANLNTVLSLSQRAAIQVDAWIKNGGIKEALAAGRDWQP